MEEKLIFPVQEKNYSYIQSVNLDDIEYLFYIRYNSRLDSFFLNMSCQGELIINGVRVVTGVDLLVDCVHALSPKGEMYCYDLDSDILKEGRDPTNETIGSRVVLVYEV
jgi:hypothetical protein